MFLNCGRAVPDGNSVRLVVWDGTIEYQFRVSTDDVSALLQERQESIPVSRMFGLYETHEYGRARLTNPTADGRRKGVVFWVPCLARRTFTVSREGLAGVARSAAGSPGDHWPEAVVSEIINEPIARMGACR